MKDIADQEVIELDDNMDVEAFNDFAREQGWSDGMPLFVPTEAKVAKFVETVRGDNRPYAPVPPRQVIPTVQALAANAVMAGCKPEYYPVATAALRGVLDPEFNLHGTLATTLSSAPMVMVSGPIRKELNINCGSNCFGQGWQANATIGRALGLMLPNVAGAKPGEMDRSTQGNPAKYTFCFG
ncbi:MAG: UGSC family (seleno)protein, partial [Rhodospirillaceae bacterium]